MVCAIWDDSIIYLIPLNFLTWLISCNKLHPPPVSCMLHMLLNPYFWLPFLETFSPLHTKHTHSSESVWQSAFSTEPSAISPNHFSFPNSIVPIVPIVGRNVYLRALTVVLIVSYVSGALQIEHTLLDLFQYLISAHTM